MGRIYRKSLCTLAAALGTDCNSGLFTRREAAELVASRMLFLEGGNSVQGPHLLELGILEDRDLSRHRDLDPGSLIAARGPRCNQGRGNHDPQSPSRVLSKFPHSLDFPGSAGDAPEPQPARTPATG